VTVLYLLIFSSIMTGIAVVAAVDGHSFTAGIAAAVAVFLALLTVSFMTEG